MIYATSVGAEATETEAFDDTWVNLVVQRMHDRKSGSRSWQKTKTTPKQILVLFDREIFCLDRGIHSSCACKSRIGHIEKYLQYFVN